MTLYSKSRAFLCAFAVFAVTTQAQTSLTSGDVELAVNFSGSLVGTGTNPWLLTVRDVAAQREYAGVRAGFADPERVLLRAGMEASTQVPEDDERYSFLGAPGKTVWILPEGGEDLLTPGVSTETRPVAGWQGLGVSSTFLVKGVPASTFLNNQISLSLVSFSGPGNFFFYRVNALFDPILSFRTDDGLESGDALTFGVGNHNHYNWAFTEPGAYTLGFRASGTLQSGSQSTQSDITTFHFRIIPEPGAASLALCGVGLVGLVRRPRAFPCRAEGSGADTAASIGCCGLVT